MSTNKDWLNPVPGRFTKLLTPEAMRAAEAVEAAKVVAEGNKRARTDAPAGAVAVV
mgnify:CR=1 FL=1